MSQSLNNTPSTIRVSAKTRKRVQRAAVEFGYRGNRAARMLRTGKSGMVGIIVAHGFQQVITEHIRCASYYASEHGLIPLIQEVSSASEESSNQRAVELMLDARVDAVFLVCFSDFPLATQFLEARIPLLSVNMPFVEHGIPKYFPDKTKGFQLLTEHLIEQGNRRMMFLGTNSQNFQSLYAESGFQTAIQSPKFHGIDFRWNVHEVECQRPLRPEELASAQKLHFSHREGYSGMKVILESKSFPDAILCTNDNWAQGALRACAEANIRVPQDITVSGFDNDPTSSAGFLPISSVGQPIKELYRQAFTDLVTALKTGEPLVEKSTVLPCELFVRESTLYQRK